MTKSPARQIVANLKDKPLPPALIIGRPNANLLAQARALGRVGLPVYCLLSRDESPLIASFSRYVTRTFDVRGASDNNIVDLVKTLAAYAGIKPVLFFGGDSDVNLAARIWPAIKDLVKPVTPPEEASAFNDKYRQIERLRRAGIPVPRTMVIYSHDDLEQFQDDWLYPVVIRPVEHARKGCFKGKIAFAQSEAEVRSKLGGVLVEGGGVFLIQEYVPGPTNSIWFVLASCDAHGRPLAMVSGRKLFEYPEGLMCVGETRSDPQIEDLAQRSFEAFGLSGVIGLEFKYDERRNKFVFIEANLRPENIIAVAEAAGVNLMVSGYLQAIGHSRSYAPNQQKPAVWQDKSLVVLSRFFGNNFQLPRYAPKRKVDAYWAWDDPLPALVWYFQKIGRLVKKIKR